MKKNLKYNHLKKSKIKLSLAFTVLILFLLISFNFIFFFGKYKKSINQDIFMLERGAKVFLDLKKGGKRKIPKILLRNKGFLSFVIKNKKTGEILFIKDDLGISDNVISSISSFGFKEIEINGDFYLINFTENKKEGVLIYSFKKTTYSKKEFHSDFLDNSAYLFLISLIIYFLSYLLISKNLKSVEENLKDMEDFIDNAGHELKTPISVISSNIQLSLKTGNFKDSNKESLIELDKMNSLINGLLSLSVLSLNSSSKKINIKKEIEEICKNNSKKIKEKNIDLKLDLKDFNFKIDKEHFYILFSNLFFNAIRYSDEKGTISIFLNSGKLEIKDNGNGISKENIQKIFDRFYQEGESRESSKGFGIGLSLVKKICDIYNLKILVESVKGNGTIFKVKF